MNDTDFDKLYEYLKSEFDDLELEKNKSTIKFILINYDYIGNNFELSSIIEKELLNPNLDDTFQIIIKVNGVKSNNNFLFDIESFDLYIECLKNLRDNTDYIGDNVDRFNDSIASFGMYNINVNLKDLNIDTNFLNFITNNKKIDILAFYFIPIIFYKYQSKNHRIFEAVGNTIDSYSKYDKMDSKTKGKVENFTIMLHSFTVEELTNMARHFNVDKEFKDRIRTTQATKAKLINEFEQTIEIGEKVKLYDTFIVKLTDKLSTLALDLLHGDNKKEKLTKINLNYKDYEFIISGWDWEVKPRVYMENNIYYSKCTCSIYKDGGMCYHLFAVYLYMYSVDKINNFPFDYIPNNLNLDNILEGTTKATAVFDGTPIFEMEHYHIYKSLTGFALKYYWFGDYNGTKVIGFNTKEEMEAELKKKVYELLTKYVNDKERHEFRYIGTDRYGVARLLVDDPKYFEKLVKVFRSLGKTREYTPDDMYYEIGGE